MKWAKEQKFLLDSNLQPTEVANFCLAAWAQ